MFRVFRTPRWLLALWVVQAGTVLVFLSFAGALPLIKSEWGLSNAQAGVIQAATQAGYITAVLVLSSVTDYLPMRRLLPACALWAGLANLGFALLARDMTSAIVWRALTGMGVAGIYMPGVRLISERVSAERRGGSVGVFVSAFTLGSAASIALGGSLSTVLGWRTAFALLSAGPIVGALVVWRALPGMPPKLAQQPAPDAGPSIAELLRNRPALLAIGAYTAHTWEVLGLRSWLPAFLATALMIAGRSLHAATAAGAGLAGTATLTGAAATAAVGALSDRAGRSLTIIMVASVSLILMLSMGFVLGAPLILAVSVAIIVAVAANADSAVISTTLTENVPGRYLGRALAMYSFCGFSAGTLSPILFGAALDYLNPASLTGAAAVPLRWEGAFGVLALGSLAALAAAVALHKVLRPRAGT